MPVAIITGSGGLIGSEAVEPLRRRGLRRRRHRERHAGQLLRPRGLDLARHRAARRRAPRVPLARTPTSATREAVDRIFREHAGADRAGHPHRRPALPRLGRERAADRLRRQRQRHPQPARGGPRPLPRGALHLLLDQQGLRRHARTGCRWRTSRSGWSCRSPTPTTAGIDTSMSIDSSTHSLFGVSKAAADLLVQEYGRYFEMPTVCFRGGCLTGPQHAGAKLHGFLAYLMKCTVTGTPYTVFGYDGQAGPRQHPQRRPDRRLRRLPQARRAPPPSTTSAAAASATARCWRRSRSASGSPAAS